ncbi:Cytochrome c [Aromatoleum tolulyticum]|uniref:Cytochrome c n=1 Tax=Aromatoleum tolulyticum TaxID=34027 RepID=A0A1N6N3N1_9RHOO|nr:c-type cytochrome [Aromatoleum tolulyticum]SIP86684.1 Cytochrome c [Aromatoleum tolulyticum]
MSKPIDPAAAARKPAARRVLAASGFTLSALAAAVALALSATPALGDAQPGGNRHSGQYIFRFDTFGDEQLWTSVLRMHEVIPAAVSPATALAVGLKVDATALPRNFLAKHDLNDPKTTVELLRRNAVVGVVGKVKGRRLVSVGITCALCHSTVDNSVAPGVGRRLDGWPNLDLNPGAIIALSPALPEEVKAVYNSWGPGRYDPRFNIDGINGPLVIPPAYGLAGVPFETFTGDGPISYWNNYVAVTQMGGHGSFSDPRLGISIEQTPDLVTPKLPALLAYQLRQPAPRPPEGSVNAGAAQRGAALFNGTARCGTCHIAPTYTDVQNGPDADTPLLHDAAETGMDPGYARRTATGRYRTTPLRALWQHPPYFHDGSAPTLGAVVDHYDTHFALGLTPEQKADLVEFLKSL